MVQAREYDSAVYSPGVPVSGPPAPAPGPDPSGTPPDVTVSAWGLHTARTTDEALGTVTDTKYVRLEYTLPADYVFGSRLVVRGKVQGTTMSPEPAWDDLGNEVTVPLAGNLPPSGGKFYLFWPVSHASESWSYFPSGVQQTHIVSQAAYKVMVRLRSLAGNLSVGVKTYSPAAFSSTSTGTDTGSSNQNTKELRLVETGGGANYWAVKSPASLSADRTLTLPDAGLPSSGLVAVDSGGNITFRKDYSFSAHKNTSDQTGITDSTWTKLTFGSEAFDMGGAYDSSNSKFVAAEAGKYVLFARTAMVPAATETLLRIALYVNGTSVRDGVSQGSLSTRGLGVSVEAILDLAASDEVEVYVYHTRGSDGTALGATSLSRFEAYRMG
ncbi:MAG: hypothetical protein L6R30_13885 [Thermoanaerobaculia bacterium]|nr:hypothetical protein [Thermoanaerobaculia bacterium]